MKPSIALVSVLGTMSLLGIAYAVATVALGATPWQYLSLVVQKHRTTVPVAYEPWTWVDFLALPTLPRAYRAPDWATVHGYTARAIRLEGYIAEAYRWRDGDVHVHLRATPSPHCFPAGPRQAQIVTEVTPAFQARHTGWSAAVLRALCEQQVRVRLSGWLLHDFEHAGPARAWRVSAWEIHPVTAIEVWDEARQAWQPLP
jgi:hypothetical protein